MIELVVCLAGAALVGWLFRRAVGRRADAAARGDAIKVPCLLRHPARQGRWLRGRLVISPAGVVWEARTRAGAAVSLPGGLRWAGVRSPSLREAMKVNGGSRIVECTAPEGTLLVSVMPHDLEHVRAALDRGTG
ncbi:hypothetical protein [Streptomyces sp. NPDC047046]|uniref:hypothetical protein n=1 Tax=Streptomyces sp. NPDC047046 TaxID=3155378 RepID=UPI00340CD328